MKQTTKDDYIKSIYRVIFYIEQNYNNNITIEELSKVACFSKYHFHRVFKSTTNQSLGDYIRMLRLSSTTLKLKTNQKITQIALDSGYESNSSFTKAFKKYFGVTPREFSQIQKNKKGIKMLNPKIVQLKPVEVLYVRKEGSYDKSAKEAWEVLMNFAYTHKMKNNKNLMIKETMTFGIGHDNPNIMDVDKLRYDACVSWDDKSVQPDGEISSKIIEGGKYACVLHKGPYENLKTIYDEIGDWIVKSGVEVRDLPMFEKYLNKDPRRTKPENLKTEIYIPLK